MKEVHKLLKTKQTRKTVHGYVSCGGDDVLHAYMLAGVGENAEKALIQPAH